MLIVILGVTLGEAATLLLTEMLGGTLLLGVTLGEAATLLLTEILGVTLSKTDTLLLGVTEGGTGLVLGSGLTGGDG